MTQIARSCLLLVGDDENVVRVARLLSGQLTVVAFAPGLHEQDGAAGVQLVGGKITAVTGALGTFRAIAAGGGGRTVDVGIFSSRANGVFDLVLDMGLHPLINPANAPAGYFSAHTEAEQRTAVECLPLLAGSHSDARPGTVRVIESRCSLCGACANACPTTALRIGGAGGSRLTFREPACIDCGACVPACPEDALSLRARASSVPLHTEVTLMQSAPARCRGCGEPFSTHAALDKVRSLTAAPAAFRALELCPQCRAQALFSPA